MDRRPARYSIRVAGRLGATSLAAFPDLECETCGSETVLTGEVRDRSALYGIIALLDDLGLELLELRPLGAGPAGQRAGGLARPGGAESGAVRR